MLTPSAIGVPPLGLAYTGDPLPCRPWTLLGFPSLALPLAWTPERLPIGLQLIGPLEGDAALLRAGRWLLDRA
jgi:Asp-tRNA(Asn)/Glu-tRNA(Gln) amidotransferase A subunit family amidase